MSRRRESPPLIPPDALRAGDSIGRRQFVRTAGGIFVAASGFACTDKMPGALFGSTTPDPALCTVTVSASAITAGGSATITLQAKGASGANLALGGATVAFTASGGTSTGSISATVDHGDGTYTAVYTGTTAGTPQSIGATINGAAVTTAMPTLTVTPAVADATRCTMSAAPSSIAVGTTSTLTLVARNSSGIALATGGDTVVFIAAGGTATGTISSATDHGNGTYTAVYTGTGAGTAQSIGATVNGAAVTTASPTVTVTTAAQAPDPTKCTVTVSPASIPVGATSTLTLQAKNPAGANLTTGGASVTFSATGGTARGTISATTDHGNGTYTAIYTATTAGTAQTIGATINGAAVTTTPPTITVTVANQVPDPTRCTVTAAPISIGIGGTSTLTLQAKNSAGANVTVGGATVVFTASGGTATGTVSATTDHGNGTYTALYTGTAAGTAQTIGATINGAGVTTAMPSITVTSSGFQTPDVINNYGFETGSWGPFNDGGGGLPSAVIATDYAYEGTHSAKYAFAPSGSDTGASMYSESGRSFDRLWVRVYIRLTNAITTQWKFIRFYDASFTTNMGGIFLSSDSGGSGNGLVCIGWDQEDSNIVTTIGLTEAQVIDGKWHSLELDFQRNGGSTGYPECSFWFDGQPQYPELNGNSTVQYAGQNKSVWVNGRINAGMRSSSAQPSVIEWMGTLNGGNSTTGQCNMDYIGVSSLGRIGP